MVLTFGLAGHASAVNWQWLHDYPARYFSNEDWDLLQQTAFKLYDNNRNKASAKWSNPETGNFGEVTVIESLTIDGKDCRKSRISNTAHTGLRGSSVYVLCKVENGEWKITEQK